MESRYDRELRVTVDREKARCSAWYEMFPRSAALEPGRHGTFRDCEARLDYVARLGFDVLYLPPIHPIGLSFRKGKNNSPNRRARRYRQSLGHRRERRRPHRYPSATRHARRFSRPCRARGEQGTSSSRSTSPSSARPIIPGSPSIRSGLKSAPTEPSSMPRIRPRNTRTSTRWISRAATGAPCGTRCSASFRFWIEQRRAHLPRR